MNEAPRMGLRPMGDAKGQVNCKSIDIDASNTVPLGIGSPYYVVAGKLRGLPAAHGNAGLIAGTIVRLATTANKSVGGVPASTAGYKAEVTWEEKQQYICTVNDTSFADNGSDNGKMYNLTDETLTVTVDDMGTGGFSKRQLDGATEAASTRQIVASGKTGLVNNVGGVANTEVFCTINSANWQSW